MSAPRPLTTAGVDQLRALSRDYVNNCVGEYRQQADDEGADAAHRAMLVGLGFGTQVTGGTDASMIFAFAEAVSQLAARDQAATS